ncbi:MAG: hypothetical protein QW115_04960, partial [Thermoplasmata archaeon]
LVEENKLSQREIANIVYSVVEACVYAYHHKGIVNCDLKPEHVMIERNGNVKVIDWGGIYRIGSTGSDEASSLVLHTLPWAAPEVREKLQKTPEDRTMVYEIGAILYWALTKHQPELQAMDKIVQASALPVETKELLAGALKEDMKERISLVEFGERLNEIYGLEKKKGRLELWLSRDERQKRLYHAYRQWYEVMWEKGIRDPVPYISWLEEICEAFPEKIKIKKVGEKYEIAMKALTKAKCEGLYIGNEEKKKIDEFLDELEKVV